MAGGPSFAYFPKDGKNQPQQYINANKTQPIVKTDGNWRRSKPNR
jgi:hypothetical protein